MQDDAIQNCFISYCTIYDVKQKGFKTDFMQSDLNPFFKILL